MPNIAVRCPVCGRIKVNRHRVEQKTFYCCQLTHSIEKNLVAEGLKRPEKDDMIEVDDAIIEETKKKEDEFIELED